MAKDSSSGVYLRFAVASFLAIAVFAVLAVLVAVPSVRRENERAAAESAEVMAADDLIVL